MTTSKNTFRLLLVLFLAATFLYALPLLRPMQTHQQTGTGMPTKANGKIVPD